MPKLSDTSIPKYCKHKATAQGVVTLDGRDFYLGKYGTAASKAEYNRLIREWLSSGRKLPVSPDAVTLGEVALAFIDRAKGYYRRADGTPTGEADRVVRELTPMTKLYRKLPAIEFGPLRLKAVRDAMIEAKWVRTSSAAARSLRLTSISSSFPASWPRLSLTILKRSKSRYMTAKRWPSRFCSAARATNSTGSFRPGSPVRTSCTVAWRSWADTLSSHLSSLRVAKTQAASRQRIARSLRRSLRIDPANNNEMAVTQRIKLPLTIWTVSECTIHCLKSEQIEQ